jgi:hypothetical protein
MATFDDKLKSILEALVDRAPKLNPRPIFGNSNTIARKLSVESL